MILYFLGIAFNVTVGVGLLQMGIGMRNDYKSLTRGLLGNFNGNDADDLLPRNATNALPNSAKESEIFKDFGQTCNFYCLFVYLFVCA